MKTPPFSLRVIESLQSYVWASLVSPRWPQLLLMVLCSQVAPLTFLKHIRNAPACGPLLQLCLRLGLSSMSISLFPSPLHVCSNVTFFMRLPWPSGSCPPPPLLASAIPYLLHSRGGFWRQAGTLFFWFSDVSQGLEQCLACKRRHSKMQNKLLDYK